MRISYNELHTNVKKACIAVGVPIGAADDAGRSACNAIESGIDYLAQLVLALEQVYVMRSSTYDPEQALLGVFVSVNSDMPLSSLNAGPSACDLTVFHQSLILLSHKIESIKLDGVDVPAIIVFEALRLSKHLRKNECILWSLDNNNGVKGLCYGGKLKILEGNMEMILKAYNCSMVMKKNLHCEIKENVKSHVGKSDNENIDVNTWSQITSYANMLLVETSESSRMEGAGAGIIDRD